MLRTASTNSPLYQYGAGESVGPGPSFIFYGLTLLLSANSPPLFALTRQQTLCIHMGQEKSSSPTPLFKSLHPHVTLFPLVFMLPCVCSCCLTPSVPFCSGTGGITEWTYEWTDIQENTALQKVFICIKSTCCLESKQCIFKINQYLFGTLSGTRSWNFICIYYFSCLFFSNFQAD